MQRITGLKVKGKLISPVLKIDLASFIDEIKDESAWKDNDRNAITVFKSDKMRIVLVALHRKAIMKTEHPEHILSLQVIKGKINVTADGNDIVAGKDQIITLHEKIPYQIKAVKKSLILLTVIESN